MQWNLKDEVYLWKRKKNKNYFITGQFWKHCLMWWSWTQLLCFADVSLFFSFHVRATTCINVQLYYSQGWTVEGDAWINKVFETKAKYKYIQVLMVIEPKCSCFTCSKLNSEFVVLNQSVFWSWTAPRDFSAFYIFTNVLKIWWKRFSYAVRPLGWVTYNWSLVDK